MIGNDRNHFRGLRGEIANDPHNIIILFSVRLSTIPIDRTVSKGSPEKGALIYDSRTACPGLVMVRCGQPRAYILSEGGWELTISRLFEYDASLLSASCVMPDMQINVMIEAEKDSGFRHIPRQFT